MLELLNKKTELPLVQIFNICYFLIADICRYLKLNYEEIHCAKKNSDHTYFLLIAELLQILNKNNIYI